MSRGISLALLCLGLVLVLFPLAVGKPGLPMTLKADEPAYYLMALSLAHDGDLRSDLHDLQRLFDEYPYRTVFNLILMTDDGWQSSHFGKPYIYSLFAAPFAGVFGANGMVAFNMALLMAMIWMGTVYLSRFNPQPLAALYSVGFFLLSTSFVYVFWLHPELFNMACVMGALFLTLHRFDEWPGRWSKRPFLRRLLGPPSRPYWSGALLAMACYSKPMMAAFALPILFALFRRDRLRSAAAWIAGSVAAMILLCAVAIAFTGHPSAYLGVERMGVKVFDPEQPPVPARIEEEKEEVSNLNSWHWLIKLPKLEWWSFKQNLNYFLWGRHTGLVPYMPFALLSVLLFLIHRRPFAERGLVLAAIVAVALYFFLWIDFNWHGGNGFVGNRYFINAYPAFLFLVTRVTPFWLPVAGYAAGSLLLGPLLFTPLGAPVPSPTLQAHVRNASFRIFPLEIGFRGRPRPQRPPGYDGAMVSASYVLGRRDIIEVRGTEMRIHGATPVELWIHSTRDLSSGVTLHWRNHARRNHLLLKMHGDRARVDFQTTPPGEGERLSVTLYPTEEQDSFRNEQDRLIRVYRLVAETATGFTPNAAENFRQQITAVNDFYVGAVLTAIVPFTDPVDNPYSVDWGEPSAPRRTAAGATFEITATLRNSSPRRWPMRGPEAVRLSYHWLTADGSIHQWDGPRTALPKSVESGDLVRLQTVVEAPTEPGDYLLQLDLVQEGIAWFSERQPDDTVRLPVEVRAPTPAAN